MGRKAIDPITGLIVLIVIGVLVTEGFYTANIIISTDVIRQDARETSAISVINGMDFLKRTMQEGVTYATERATYDVLANGGYSTVPADLQYSNGEAYWRKYDKTFVPDFSSNLATAVAAHFQSYGSDYGSAYPFLGSSMGISPVSLGVPAYSSCGAATVTEKDPNTVSVSIASNCPEGLQASNEFMTITESNANFAADVPVNGVALVSKAEAVFAGSDRPVYQAVVDGTSDSGCSATESPCIASSCGVDASCAGTALLQTSQCSGWKSRLSDSIKSQLDKIIVSGATVSYSILSISADATVVSCSDMCTKVESSTQTCICTTHPADCSSCDGLEQSCTPPSPTQQCTTTHPASCSDCIEGTCTSTPIYGTKQQYTCRSSPGSPAYTADSCDGCVSCEGPSTVTVQTGSTNDCVSCTTEVRATCTTTSSSDSGGDCSCSTSVTTIGWRTSCTYSYKAYVNVEVTLQPTGGQYYPIYDSTSEKTQWSQMRLKFVVLDGTLGSSQPSPVTTTTTTTLPSGSTTTTTTLLPCPAISTQCGQIVSNCMCGTATCGIGQYYCCAATNSCQTGSGAIEACSNGCVPQASTTTTTTTLPSCPYASCNNWVSYSCTCGTRTCSPNQFCCSAASSGIGACEDANTACTAHPECGGLV